MTSKGDHPNQIESQFKPGQIGNPEGRPPEAALELRNYTKKEVQEVFAKIMRMKGDEVMRVRDSQDSTILESAVASVLLRARAKGDHRGLDILIDRVIGKVPQKTELTGADGEALSPAVLNFAPYPGPDPYEKPAVIQPALPAVEQIPPQPTSGQPPAV